MLKILLSILMVVLVVAGLIFLKAHQNTQPVPTQVISGVQPTVPAKVTQQNEDQTLSQTDQAVGNAMDQMDKDLQALNQNNTSADNTNGL